MGHGWLVVSEVPGVRIGFRAKKSPPVWRRRALFFLVNLSVAYFAYKSAIICDLYMADSFTAYKLFFKKGLDKISTGTCGAANCGTCGFAAIRGWDGDQTSASWPSPVSVSLSRIKVTTLRICTMAASSGVRP
ncbi:hypothetical protein [Occallatibacter riparius]|uniref:Uncharacterized protein n=1 Tax=Occallatibacter riparius TaxID=1002689 RepID=A0A9J7BU71_9BACT|nr:hypothetical protein [Occallatibacter riparius]UWZ86199.1 hypothetical protein MOP44_09695 [Occallatibacter riparius]